MRFRFVLFVAVLSLLSACSTLPNPGQYAWVPSPNINERRPNYVIIHQTDSASHERALSVLTNPVAEVSAHYLIAEDGHITQLVDERMRAWHAGQSWWGGQTDMNSASIGIELQHYGDASFAPEQIDALVGLLNDIASRQRIPVANYLAHGDVALGRKVDPNYQFPWQRLAEQGFGVWCSTAEAQAFEPMADGLLGLQALGYDINKPEAAAAAFRRHYRSQASGDALDNNDLRVLTCLLSKRFPA